MVHDKYRKFKFDNKGSYNKIVDNLELIPFSERKSIKIISVFTPITLKYLTNAYSFIQKLGFRDINFLPTFQFEQWNKKNMEYLKHSLIDFRKKCLKNYDYAKDRSFTISNPQKFYSSKNKISNGISYKLDKCDKLCVDCNGNFYPCERLLGLSEGGKESWGFGNIKKMVDLSMRKRILKDIRIEIAKKFPEFDLKESRFCPFSFYFLSFRKDKKNTVQAIKHCLNVSKIYDRLFAL